MVGIFEVVTVVLVSIEALWHTIPSRTVNSNVGSGGAPIFHLYCRCQRVLGVLRDLNLKTEAENSSETCVNIANRLAVKCQKTFNLQISNF
jgi:hypothetical protein